MDRQWMNGQVNKECTDANELGVGKKSRHMEA